MWSSKLSQWNILCPTKKMIDSMLNVTNLSIKFDTEPDGSFIPKKFQLANEQQGGRRADDRKKIAPEPYHILDQELP